MNLLRPPTTRPAPPRSHPIAGAGCIALVLAIARFSLPAFGSSDPTPLTWLWASPLPHGNHIYDFAYEGGIAVQVGDRGRAYVSFDEQLWSPRPTGTERALRSLTSFHEQLVISGEAGTILYAARTNLAAGGTAGFTLVDLGTSDWLEGIAASSSRLLAVGDHGTLYTSTNLTHWTRLSSGVSSWLRGVAYGNGVFVAVGESGTIARIDSKLSISQPDSGATADLNRAARIGHYFVVVGNSGTLLFSTDGSSWIERHVSGLTNDLCAVAGTTSSSNTNLIHFIVAGSDAVWTFTADPTRPPQTWECADETDSARSAPAPAWEYYGAYWTAASGSTFRIGGSGGLLIEGVRGTNDMYEWTNLSPLPRVWLWDVTRAVDLPSPADRPTLRPWSGFVTVGDLGLAQTSSDGVAWNLEVTPTNAAASVLLGVGAGPEGIVAVGSRGTLLFSPNTFQDLILTNETGLLTTNSVSTLGVVWTAVEPRPTDVDLQGIVWHRDHYYTTGGDGTILASSDGTHWSLRAQPVTTFLSGLASFPEGIAAVGEQGTILTSSDGTLWTSVASLTTNWLYRVRYLGNQLIAVGENGALLTSPDGRSWFSRASGTTNWLQDVALLRNVYYAVGTQGTVQASSNAISWQSVAGITRKSLCGVTADAQQLVAVGIDGIIARAHPGPLALLDHCIEPQTNNFLHTFLVSAEPGRSCELDAYTYPRTNSSGSPLLTTNRAPLGSIPLFDQWGASDLKLLRTNPVPSEFYRGRLLP